MFLQKGNLFSAFFSVFSELSSASDIHSLLLKSQGMASFFLGYFASLVLHMEFSYRKKKTAPSENCSVTSRELLNETMATEKKEERKNAAAKCNERCARWQRCAHNLKRRCVLEWKVFDFLHCFSLLLLSLLLCSCHIIVHSSLGWAFSAQSVFPGKSR